MEDTCLWKVYFEGGFWLQRKNAGRPGKEIAVHKHFDWAGRHWVIPAIYPCAKGLVIDFCMRVDPPDIRTFMEKWDLNVENEASKRFTREEEMQLELDNPFCLNFRPTLQLNRKQLFSTHGYGTTYNPCVPEDYVLESEALNVVEHYGLDPAYGWGITRSCFPWATKRKPKLRALSIAIEQRKASIPGPHFRVSKLGDTFGFTYPEGGETHTLTVQEYEEQTLDASRMVPPDLEYPTQYHVMSYTIVPELPDGLMTIADCADGDRPRQKPRDPNGFEPTAVHDAAVIGIIGGADGPTAILYGRQQGESKLRAACSSLQFEPVKAVEWRLVFHEKQFADTTIALELPHPEY